MPNITEITVSAGRAVSNPYQQYENFKPSVSIKAAIASGEDVERAALDLQGRAEKMLDVHQELILRKLDEQHGLVRPETAASNTPAVNNNATDNLEDDIFSDVVEAASTPAAPARPVQKPSLRSSYSNRR